MITSSFCWLREAVTSIRLSCEAALKEALGVISYHLADLVSDKDFSI